MLSISRASKESTEYIYSSIFKLQVHRNLVLLRHNFEAHMSTQFWESSQITNCGSSQHWHASLLVISTDCSQLQ